jgi:GT2 family glycosyltransferase
VPDRIADAVAERGLPAPDPADVLLLWLDDDTTLPTGFLAAVADAAARHRDADVFLPIVEDAAGILSPCAAGRFRPHRLREAAFPGDGLLRPERRFSAINSGMAVRSTVYAGRRYDEGYFLDFLDHDFLRDLRSAGIPFRLLPERLTQAFSDTGASTPDAALARYRLFRRDFRRYQARSGSAAARAFGEAYLLFRAAKLSLRHRTTSFLRTAFGRGA